MSLEVGVGGFFVVEVGVVVVVSDRRRVRGDHGQVDLRIEVVLSRVGGAGLECRRERRLRVDVGGLVVDAGPEQVEDVVDPQIVCTVVQVHGVGARRNRAADVGTVPIPELDPTVDVEIGVDQLRHHRLGAADPDGAAIRATRSELQRAMGRGMYKYSAAGIRSIPDSISSVRQNRRKDEARSTRSNRVRPSLQHLARFNTSRPSGERAAGARRSTRLRVATRSYPPNASRAQPASRPGALSAAP